MIRKLIFFFSIVVFTTSFSAQTNTGMWNWSESISHIGAGSSAINAMVPASGGYIYATGFFSGNAVFSGTYTLTSSGSTDIFVAKYDTVSGACLWAVKAGGSSTNDDAGNSIAVDNAGNIFVTGYTYGTSTFGTNTVTGLGGRDIFIAKYNAANGNCIWARLAGSTSLTAGDQGKTITTDILGNIYVTGSFGTGADNGTFGTFIITNSTGVSGGAFAVKYDQNGNCKWAQKADNGGGFSVCADKKGNLYWSATTSSVPTLFKLNAYTGNVISSITWNATGPINSIVTDAADNVYIAGGFLGNTTFGSFAFNHSRYAIFVAKYDTSLNCVWMKDWQNVGISANNQAQATKLFIAPSGNLYASAITYDKISIEPGEYLWPSGFGSPTHVEALLIKLDNNGNTQWGEKPAWCGYQANFAYSIAVFSNEARVYGAGSYQHMSAFGTDNYNTGNSLLYEGVLYSLIPPNKKQDNVVNWKWVKQEATANPITKCVTSDLNGNVYVSGTSTSALYFEVSKYSSTGTLLWTKNATSGVGAVLDIRCDNAGYVYVVGSFNFTFTLDAKSVTTYGNNDIFIAKLNPATGACMWLKKAGSTAQDGGNGIYVDANANAYITGWFRSTGNFPPYTVVAPGSNPFPFLAKYDSSGTCQWVLSPSGGINPDYGVSVSGDNAGNIYYTGNYSLNITFGGTTLTSTGGDDIFIVKYNSFGTQQWAKSAGGSNGNEKPTELQCDGSGNCYLTGSFFGTASFDANTVSANNNYEDGFVAKYDANGNNVWVRDNNGCWIDIFEGVTLDASGNVYVIGSFDEQLFAGNTNYMHTTNENDMVVMKYSTSGNYLWSQNFDGGDEAVNGRDIDYNPATNKIFVAGDFKSKGYFGNDTLTTAGSTELFVGEINDLDYCTMNANLVVTSPACNTSNGSLAVNIIGGNSPFSYKWSNGSTASTITNLPAGSYSVTVTDVNGCFKNLSSLIGFSINATSTSPLCNSGTNGTGNVTLAGGQSPFTYQWSNGETTQNAVSLSPGTHVVAVTDNSGCVLTDTVTNINPPAITSYITNTKDSAYVVVTSGASYPYTYQWSNGSTNYYATALTYDTYYSVTITDANGCIRNDSVMVPKPADWLWVKDYSFPGTTGNLYFSKPVFDSNGDLYVGANYTGTVTIGTNTFTSTGLTDILLLKFTPSGTLLWAVSAITGTGQNICTSITRDTSGNIYISGYFTNTMTLGGTVTLTNYGASTEDAFLARFNSAGTSCAWAIKAGGTSGERANDVIANAGGVYITGSYASNPSVFGPYSIASSGASDAYVAKYDVNGNCVWVKKAGGTTTDEGKSIALDATGNIYVGGAFTGTCSFTTATFTTTPINAADPFLAKYNSAGTEQWVRRGMSSYSDNVFDLAVDASGNALLAGSYEYDFATFGSINFDLVEKKEGFIVKYSPSGNEIWGKALNGDEHQEVRSIATDSDNNIYVIGFMYGKTNFTTTYALNLVNVTSVDPDFYIAKLDSSSVLQWATVVGSPYSDYGNNIAVHNDQIYATGSFRGTNVLFNPLLLSSASTTISDAFVGKLSDLPLLNASVVYTNVTCNGANDGTASVTSGGGLPPYSYNWNPGALTTASVTGLTPGNYTVTVTDGQGSTVQSTVTITQPAPVPANAGANVSYCTGGSVTLSASGGVSYEWSPSSGLSDTTISNPVASPSATTVYTVTVTDNAGCFNTDNVMVTVNNLPAVNYSQAPDTVCSGDPSFSLTGGTPAGGTYSGTGISANTFNPSTAGVGTYLIVYAYTDANTCNNSDTSSITVKPSPSVNYSQTPNIFCADAPTFSLSSGTPSGGTYSGTGVIGNTFDPSVSGSGTFQVVYSYTDTNACTANAISSIIINALPVVNYIQTPSVFCDDAGVQTLSSASPAGGSYSGTGVSGNTFDPAVSGTGTFTIVYSYTDGNLCSNSDSAQVTVNVCTGMSEAGDENAFTVWPNPSENILNVSLKSGRLISGGRTTLKLFNPMGELVILKNLQAENSVIDLTDLSSGVYYLMIKTDAEEFWGKVIKQ